MKPNVVSYSTVINAFAKANNPDQAASWLDTMREARNLLRSPSIPLLHAGSLHASTGRLGFNPTWSATTPS